MITPTEMITTKQKYIRLHCELGDHPITWGEAYVYIDKVNGITEEVHTCGTHLLEWCDQHYGLNCPNSLSLRNMI